MEFFNGISYIQQFFAEQFALYSYQNYLEVAFLSMGIYKILRLVQKDTTKHLSLYIYGYSGALITSHIMHAWVLFWILLFSMPVFIIVLILAHQTTIQKHFIATSQQKINALNIADNQWPELLIRSLTLASHQSKHIFCIIQRTQPIQHFLDIPCMLDVIIHQNALELLLNSTNIENPTIMLLDSHGRINAVNISWSQNLNKHLLYPQHHQTLQHNLQAISFLTQATDAIAFYIDPQTQTATLWHQTSNLQNISIAQLLSICQKLVIKTNNNNPETIKGDIHGFKNNSTHTAPSRH